MRPLPLPVALAFLVGCGSSDKDSFVPIAGENVIPVVVDPGPQDSRYTNGLFAEITICVPGTAECQVVDHLLVDTGSVGVRVLESILTVGLPPATTADGSILAECTPFVDGTAWGPVRYADVKLGGMTAPGLPIQLIGDTNYPMPTSTCSGTPITNFKTLGAYGILGVGIYLQDCGPSCAQPATSASNAGLYYGCSASKVCTVASVPVEAQVPNPVAALPSDNNGVLIELPSVPATGSPSVDGYMAFGIGTQANNDLGSAAVLGLDRRGYVTTQFPAGGTGYTSFLDSGSNGLFFLNSATSNIPSCSKLPDFYCPPRATTFRATVQGSNGVSQHVEFGVANAESLRASSCAFSNLAGPMPGFPSDAGIPGFDWGLPFFFGRRVFTAIEDSATPFGTGPFFAF